MVFQLYLDDSSTSPTNPLISISGLVAEDNSWRTLEPIWNTVMTNYDVPILHTKNFHNTDGPFKGWSGLKKMSFVKEIFAPAKGQILQGISFSLRNKSLKVRKSETGKFKNLSGYGICFSALLVRLLNGFPFSNEIAEHGLSIFIEAGNKNNSGILDFSRKSGGHSLFRSSLREVREIRKEDCRAIQLADFLAFYARKHAENVDRFDGALAIPLGRYFEEMERCIPCLSHTITDPIAGDSNHPTSDYPFVTGVTAPKRV